MSLMGSFVLLTLYLKGIGNKGIDIRVKKNCLTQTFYCWTYFFVFTKFAYVASSYAYLLFSKTSSGYQVLHLS